MPGKENTEMAAAFRENNTVMLRDLVLGGRLTLPAWREWFSLVSATRSRFGQEEIWEVIQQAESRKLFERDGEAVIGG